MLISQFAGGSDQFSHHEGGEIFVEICGRMAYDDFGVCGMG